MFQVGIASWICETDGTTQALRRIAQHGFRNVELWGNYAHVDPRRGEDISRVLDVLTAEGLRAMSLHAPYEFRGVNIPKEPWGAWEELMEQVVTTARDFGVDFMVVHPVLLCFPSDPPEGKPDVTACEEDTLRRVARLAGNRGIKIALENLCRKTAPAFADLDRLVTLARRVGEENVGICFDTGHRLASGLDPLRELDHCASMLCSFHAHENDGVEDLHWVPGRGRIDWTRFLERLRDMEYRGAFVLELWGGPDAESVMRIARAFLKWHRLTAVS